MTRTYTVQIDDMMTPVKVELTPAEAEGALKVLKAIAAGDPDALVEMLEEEEGTEVFSNYDEWAKAH